MYHLHRADVNLKTCCCEFGVAASSQVYVTAPGEMNRHYGADHFEEKLSGIRMKRNPNPNCRPRGSLLQSPRVPSGWKQMENAGLVRR